MNGNNQNPGQVPDARLEQLMERLRRTEEQNQQLRGQIDFIARNQQGGQQQQGQQRQSKFAPEVQQAIAEEVAAIVAPLQQKYEQQQGFLYDQLDEARFRLEYGKPQYETYFSEVDRIREDAKMKGQYLTREQALQYVYFKETGKKPAPENTKQAQAQTQGPQFDAFLGQYVDPATGKVVPPPGAVDADEAMRMAAEGQQPQQQPQQQQQMMQQPMQQPQQFAPQQQFAQQPMQQQWQQPQFQQQQQNHQQWVPQQGNQAPQLPMAQPPEAHQIARPGQHLNIDLASSDQALAQWENKYGDVPL